jgi:hypothetical protein
VAKDQIGLSDDKRQGRGKENQREVGEIQLGSTFGGSMSLVKIEDCYMLPR